MKQTEFSVMEDVDNSKFFKFFVAWIVGMVCLPGLSYVGGAILTSAFRQQDVESIAVVFFFIGWFFLWPCTVFTGVVAAVTAFLAPTVRKAVLASAAVNLGIIAILVLLMTGLIPVARLTGHI